MDQQNNVKVTRSTKGTRLVIITAIILAALILLNVGVGLIPRAWSNFVADSSDAFSISAKSKAFFKNLDTDVTIYYIYDPEMTYDYQCAAKFRVMLDRYARLNDHLTIQYVDVTDEEFIAKYYPSGLIGSSLIIEGPDRFDVISYDELFKYAFANGELLLTYENLVTVINDWMSLAENYSQMYGQEAAVSYADQQIAKYYGIENFYTTYSEIIEGEHRYWYADAMITCAVDYVTTEAIPTTYILTGHNEAALSETFTSMYLDGLSIRYFSIDLDKTGSIPANATTLVLNAPESDITEQEKTLLAGFIANGGSLILNTTPDAAELTNLMALMSTYGLSASNAIVLDDSLNYNEYLKGDEKPTESETQASTEQTTETETESEAETEADAQAQAEEQTTDGTTESQGTTEEQTFPEDYLIVLPNSKHEMVATADEIIHTAMIMEIYSMYMAAYEQYQSTGNSMYQAYAQYYQQMLESYRNNPRNYQMLIAGAHPITYTEKEGVSVTPIATTSDNGYLTTDVKATKYNMAVSATVTNGSNTGCIVWFGFADSFSQEVAEELQNTNYGFLYAAVDYAGGTEEFASGYADISAIDLGGSLDMHWGWLIGIAAFSIILLPLATIITGIVICVKRKLQ